MQKQIIALALAAMGACFVAFQLANTQPLLVESDSLFESFINKYNKEYTEEEKAFRFEVFQNNLRIINEHNAKTDKKYTMAINKFSDLTSEEFAAFSAGLDLSQKTQSNVKTLETVDLPSHVDWTTRGAVTPVKNQGQCGSCWSFSTTGSLEGLHAIKKGSLLSFSEQQLMDCSWLYGNNGCNGGLMDNAFKYVQKKGIERESSYPYTARSSYVCKYKRNLVAFNINGHQDVPEHNVRQLEAAVVQQPVSIAVQANQPSWQSYNGGVVDSDCGQQLDHGVLIVGYGTEGGTPYWKVKNSWGADWGEEGYIRILRSNADVCGVLNLPSYPTL